MLEKAFELAVVFSAVDRMTGPVKNMAKELGILDEQTKQVQKRMNEFKNMAFVGGAITMAGAGLAKVMTNGLDTAGQFLTTMTMIKDTTGATADQMDKIQKTIRDSSGKTIFGVQDTANYAKLLATSGMNGNQINSLLPLFTQYAEVQKLGKGSDPTESIQQAIGAAHTIGAYDPKTLSAFLDKYNKATFMQPGSSSEYADTFKYVSSRTAGLNMSSDDMLMLSALSNRVGLVGSMGGTEAADMILRSIPGLMGGSAKKDSKQTAALKELGLANTVYDKNGQFKGVGNFIEQLNKDGKKFNPEQLAKLFHDAFGQQGMGLASILASPRGMEQLNALQQQMGSMKSIGQMQEDTNQTPEGQRLQLKTNIENLKLDVWLQLAKILNPIFKDINNIVSKIQAFSDAHPQVAKLAAQFLIFATAAALIIGPLLLVIGTLGYLKEAGIIAAGLKMLGDAFSFLLSPIGLIIIGALALIAGLVYLWNTNLTFRKNVTSAWKAIQKDAQIVFKGIKTAVSTVWEFFKKNFLPTLKSILDWAISEMPTIQKIFQGAFDIIASVVSAAWEIFSKMLLPALQSLWDFVKPIFPVIGTIIGGILDGIIGKVKDVIDIFDKVTIAIKGAIDEFSKWNDAAPQSRTVTTIFGNQKVLDRSTGIYRHAEGGIFTRPTLLGNHLFGEAGPEAVVPLNKIDNGKQSKGEVHYHNELQPGAIVINAAPGQSPDEIADAVIRKLGLKARNKSLSRSTKSTLAW